MVYARGVNWVSRRLGEHGFYGEEKRIYQGIGVFACGLSYLLEPELESSLDFKNMAAIGIPLFLATTYISQLINIVLFHKKPKIEEEVKSFINMANRIARVPAMTWGLYSISEAIFKTQGLEGRADTALIGAAFVFLAASLYASDPRPLAPESVFSEAMKKLSKKEAVTERSNIDARYSLDALAMIYSF